MTVIVCLLTMTTMPVTPTNDLPLFILLGAGRYGRSAPANTGLPSLKQFGHTLTISGPSQMRNRSLTLKGHAQTMTSKVDSSGSTGSTRIGPSGRYIAWLDVTLAERGLDPFSIMKRLESSQSLSFLFFAWSLSLAHAPFFAAS